MRITSYQRRVDTTTKKDATQAQLSVFTLGTARRVNGFLLHRGRVKVRYVCGVITSRFRLFSTFHQYLLRPERLRDINGHVLSGIALLRTTGRLTTLVNSAIGRRAVNSVRQLMCRTTIFRRVMVVGTV